MKEVSKPATILLLVELLTIKHSGRFLGSTGSIAALIELEFNIKVNENLLTSYVRELTLEEEEALIIYNLCVQ